MFPDARDYYARRSGVYDRETSKRRDARWPQRQTLSRLLRESLEAQSGGLLLDVGIGTGRVERALSIPRTWRVLGVDASESMARRATQELEATDLDVHVVVGDAHRLPVASHCADLVVCVSVLQYLRLDEALGEIARCTKPGGRILSGVVMRHEKDVLNWRRNAFLEDEHAQLREYRSSVEVVTAMRHAGVEIDHLEVVTFRRLFRDIAADRRLLDPGFDVSGLMNIVATASPDLRDMYEIDGDGFTQHYGVFTGSLG